MAQKEIPSSDRLRELSAINADIAVMLRSAGQAINALTNRPFSTSTGIDDDVVMAEHNDSGTLEDRKTAFTEHTKAYYTNLQAVVARLKRQAYALEEAGIISPEASLLEPSAQHGQGGSSMSQGRPDAIRMPGEEADRITNGGLGNLDVGWLNSRGNKVGAGKESELIQEAKELLELVLSENNGS